MSSGPTEEMLTDEWRRENFARIDALQKYNAAHDHKHIRLGIDLGELLWVIDQADPYRADGLLLIKDDGLRRAIRVALGDCGGDLDVEANNIFYLLRSLSITGEETG